MKKIFLFSFLFTLPAYPEVYSKIKPVECKLTRGRKTEIRSFTLHDNYSLFIPFESLGAFVSADHMGTAGSPGDGYRYVIYVKDQQIGGYKQGASSSTIRTPLANQDITFEDPKYFIKVRCMGTQGRGGRGMGSPNR